MSGHSAAAISDAFNRTNGKATWSARPNSRDSADVVIFASPSELIELSYDTFKERFLVRFVRVQAPFRAYMIAIAKSLTYVLQCLSESGLSFTPPPSWRKVEVTAALSGQDVEVWFPGMFQPPAEYVPNEDDAQDDDCEEEPDDDPEVPETDTENNS